MAFITANWNPLGDAFYRSVLHTPDSEHLGAQLISAGGPENRTSTGSEPAQFTQQPGHMTPLKVASGTEHTCPPERPNSMRCSGVSAMDSGTAWWQQLLMEVQL
ncbi:hypothetical protein XENOCAPTIV_025710, partial [Xenoophorus captivus]